MRLFTPLSLIAAALLLFASGPRLAAQSGGDSTPAISEAQQLLQKASGRLAETETVRFNLEVDGDTYIDETETLRLVNARGELARPDMVDVEFQVEILGTQTVSIRMITIGEESWTTDLISGEWGPSPDEFGYDPTVLFDNQDGLGPVAGRLESPQIEGKEEVGSREAWKIVGTVDDSVIEPMTSGTIKGEAITITLWLDVETNDMLRLEVAEPEDSDKDNPATWTMTLSDHDSDVSIERPDLDE
ncbi:MAG TPA: LppX_LprAFG lipoprotein [Thermomicrobiales bacterium]|nr:LppX_LprAFG lipoprotein [Thermomicrobiales bacterium]